MPIEFAADDFDVIGIVVEGVGAGVGCHEESAVPDPLVEDLQIKWQVAGGVKDDDLRLLEPLGGEDAGIFGHFQIEELAFISDRLKRFLHDTGAATGVLYHIVDEAGGLGEEDEPGLLCRSWKDEEEKVEKN